MGLPGSYASGMSLVMDRQQFRETLVALDLSERSEEQPHRQKMLELLDGVDGCFTRDAFPGHFTGSALVVNADGSRVLLHHHRKLDRWLQFGGHCDGDSNLPRVAAREALEESGIEGLILASARPFDLDIHEIPARGNEPVHFHYDVRYMFIAPEGAKERRSEESHALGWFSAEEALQLPVDAGLCRMINKWQALVARRRAH